MHSRFHGQIGRGIALTVSVIALSGCVQATRHSNTMVFGTNTTVGFKVGQNVNQVPEIMLAYDRQEAVIMPLLANVDGDNDSGLLDPCDPTKPPATAIAAEDGENQYTVHPCSFVAYRGGALDSYSVLASFGADFEGGAEVNGSNNEIDAGAGLAQYFATGMAAQMLAMNGGAAVVSTNAPAPSAGQMNAAASVFASAEERDAARLLISEYATFASTFTSHLNGKNDDDVRTFIAAFEQAVNFPVLSSAGSPCTSAETCSAMINNDAYKARFQGERDKYNSVLAGLIEANR